MMLNTDDWPHGFQCYNQANRDTHLAERISDTGMGTPEASHGEASAVLGPMGDSIVLANDLAKELAAALNASLDVLRGAA